VFCGATVREPESDTLPMPWLMKPLLAFELDQLMAALSPRVMVAGDATSEQLGSTTTGGSLTVIVFEQVTCLLFWPVKVAV
jgi:hypothetical protein